MKPPKTPEEKKFESFTLDTTPELALYCNVAVDRMNNLLSGYEQKEIYIDKQDFWDTPVRFATPTYLHLQVYFWKEKVSRHFATLKESDIELIHLLLKKLVALRNYHSHFYHDDLPLYFTEKLQDLVKTQFEKVKNQLWDTHPNFDQYIEELKEDKTDYEKDGEKRTDVYHHFDFFDPKGKITPEGKNFFLSFFLLKGEMAKFLKKRNRCKRDNGEKYQVKSKLLTFLCHRDGSNRFFLTGKEEFLDAGERIKRQYNSLLNYLKSKPVVDRAYLPPTREITLFSKEDIEDIKEERKNNLTSLQKPLEEKEFVRRKDKFLGFAVRYMMDRKLLQVAEESSIYWHVIAKDLEEVEKQKTGQITDPNKASYFQDKTEWHKGYVPGFFPVFKNRHIKFKLEENGTEYAIGEREIKNWLYYLLNNTERKTLAETCEAVTKYGLQYKSAMQQLIDEQKIDFDLFPLVFDKGKESVALSEMHRSLLENRSFNLETYRSSISKALKEETTRLNAYLGKKEEYSRNRKNRIILECFDWYLPLEAKLKPEEVNKLSVYNFVSDDKKLSDKTRESIIAEISKKLVKAKDNNFNILKHAQSLDDLFTQMVGQKLGSLQKEDKELSTKTQDQLHPLAAKLSVSMHGTDQSRNGKNRLDELKETIRKKPVLIPNGLFKRAFSANDKDSISQKLTKNNQFMGLLIQPQYTLQSQDEFINHPEHGLKDISTEVLQVVGQYYDTYFKQHIKTYEAIKKDNSETKSPFFEGLVSLFEAQLPGPKTAEQRKQIVKAINLYKSLIETKVQDSLLAQVLFQYHNQHLPIKDREAKHQNIATLYEAEYELTISPKRKIKLKYKQLDDLATHWNRQKLEHLFANPYYWSSEIEKALEEKGKLDDQQKILVQLNKVFEDSFHYIKTFLEVEKKVLKKVFKKFKKDSLQELIEESKARRNFGLTRIEPEMLVQRLEKITREEADKFIKLRQSAFHTDVPKATHYETEKKVLASKAGIVESKKRDKEIYTQRKSKQN